MHEQVNCEESYISLSAFLCLDHKKEYESINESKIQPTTSTLDNNATLIDLNYEPISRSEAEVQDQENNSSLSMCKQKKEKKEYSKNYRKKHKEYVENLRIMNQKYEKKIEELTLKIDQMAHEIRCLKYGKQIGDNLFDSPFIKEKQETLKELVNEAEHKKQTSWQKLKKFSDVYGFAGKQKINLLNYYMSQIIDHLLIDQNKNFILNSLEDFQMVKPYAKRIQQIEMEILEYSHAEINQLRKFLKKLMPQTLKKFHKCGQDFYQSYVNLINQAKVIEKEFSNIEEGLFKLIQADKYLAVLKWFEQNKHSKQVQLMRKEWFESFRKR